jgi:hypothetical protein
MKYGFSGSISRFTGNIQNQFNKSSLHIDPILVNKYHWFQSSLLFPEVIISLQFLHQSPVVMHHIVSARVGILFTLHRYQKIQWLHVGIKPFWKAFLISSIYKQQLISEGGIWTFSSCQALGQLLLVVRCQWGPIFTFLKPMLQFQRMLFNRIPAYELITNLNSG